MNCFYAIEHVIGIFGYTSGAEIKNLGVIGPEVDGGQAYATGALIGYMDSGTISDCYVDKMVDTGFLITKGPGFECLLLDINRADTHKGS